MKILNKNYIFIALGILLPIVLGMFAVKNIFDSEIVNSIVGPFSLFILSPTLIFISTIPLVVWAVIASIYGIKNKPIVHAYTIGMIIGIVLTIILVLNGLI